MKLKYDFVTNSSSTSYILSDSRENRKESSSISLTIEVSDLLDRLNGSDIIKTEEKLKEYFEYQYGNDFLSYEGDSKKKFEKCLQEIKKGNDIIIFKVSNDDGNQISNFLYYNMLDQDDKIKLSKGIKIINDED